MDLSSVALPAAWTIAGWTAALPLLAWAVYRAPWDRFRASELAHVWFGAIFCSVVLWNIQATVGEGFTAHLLGSAAFTLVAGPALALVGSAIAVALLIGVRGGLWINGGIVFATMVAVPVAVAAATHFFARRRMPPNLFVYLFFGAFFGGALALSAAGIAGATALAFGAGVSPSLAFGEYAPYFLYLAFGEATLTGMVLTMLVVYRPQWVSTFDDAHYLQDR